MLASVQVLDASLEMKHIFPYMLPRQEKKRLPSSRGRQSQRAAPHINPLIGGRGRKWGGNCSRSGRNELHRRSSSSSSCDDDEAISPNKLSLPRSVRPPVSVPPDIARHLPAVAIITRPAPPPSPPRSCLRVRTRRITPPLRCHNSPRHGREVNGETRPAGH